MNKRLTPRASEQDSIAIMNIIAALSVFKDMMDARKVWTGLFLIVIVLCSCSAPKNVGTVVVTYQEPLYKNGLYSYSWNGKNYTVIRSKPYNGVIGEKFIGVLDLEDTTIYRIDRTLPVFLNEEFPETELIQALIFQKVTWPNFFIKYKYSVNNRTYVGLQDFMKEVGFPLEKGDSVTIRYWKRNPRRSVIYGY